MTERGLRWQCALGQTCSVICVSALGMSGASDVFEKLLTGDLRRVLRGVRMALNRPQGGRGAPRSLKAGDGASRKDDE
jgi:hypothetical protein